MGYKHFQAAMYLRLSREDSTDRASGKAESNSIGNQRELIRSFIQNQKDMELFDIYVDDGYTGSNYDRPEFKRMMADIEAGRANCIIVKDLSRFGRDYIESGRYIQKVFPSLGVRFIALTDHYDSLKADTGESGILLPIKNFINDSYCRDISTKVKSQFEVKRKNGECIAPFVLYGYRRSDTDKSKLVPDSYAAGVVKSIFEWKIEGIAVSAIAARLNEWEVLSPSEYKRFTGINYRGGFSRTDRSLWSSSTVKRILTNEMYLGHLIQGKTEKINYKVKRSIEKPKEEWIKAENTHEAIISEDTFRMVQNLLKTDGRVSPVTKKNSFFTGILFCGDCGEQMIRRINRYKDTEKAYYICSTKNRGEGCSRHSILEKTLKEIVTEIIGKYVDLWEKKILPDKSGKTDQENMLWYECDITRLKKERDRYDKLCCCLQEDLQAGVVTGEEFERLYEKFEKRISDLKKAQKFREEMKAETKQGRKQEEIDRHTFCSMVKQIRVYENRRIEIEFAYRKESKAESEHEGKR